MKHLIKILDNIPDRKPCAVFYRQVVIDYIRNKHPQLRFHQVLRRVDRLKHILSHKHVVAELNIMRSWNGQVMRYQHPEIIPKDFK